jgi:hypothetical protein
MSYSLYAQQEIAETVVRYWEKIKKENNDSY